MLIVVGLLSLITICHAAQSNEQYLDTYDSCTGCLPYDVLIQTDPTKIQADLTIELLAFATAINDSSTRLEWSDFVTAIASQKKPSVQQLLDYAAEHIESFLLLQKNQPFAAKIRNISFDWCQNVESICRLYSLNKLEIVNRTLNCTLEACPLYDALSQSYPPHPWLHYDYSIFAHRIQASLLNTEIGANEKFALMYEEMIRLMRRNHLLREAFVSTELQGFGTLMDLFVALRKIYPSQRIKKLLSRSLIDPEITLLENNLRILEYKAKMNLNETLFEALRGFIDRLAKAANADELVSIYNDLKEVDPATVDRIRAAQIYELFTFGDLIDSLKIGQCAVQRDQLPVEVENTTENAIVEDNGEEQEETDNNDRNAAGDDERENKSDQT